MKLLIFQVGKNCCAIPLNTVEGVELAAALTPLPGVPPLIAGCLNYRGDILPVFNMASRFGMSAVQIQPGDRLIVARTSKRRLILWVNSVSEGIEDQLVMDLDAPGKVNPIQGLRGATEIGDEVVLIHDLEAFLSPDEETQLETAIRKKEKTE